MKNSSIITQTSEITVEEKPFFHEQMWTKSLLVEIVKKKNFIYDFFNRYYKYKM